jgi:hypothetical protein
MHKDAAAAGKEICEPSNPKKKVGWLCAALLVSTILLVVSVPAVLGQANPPVNRDSAIGADFERRVADYMKLHAQAVKDSQTAPKASASPQEIVDYQHQLTAKIRDLRPQATQGEIFTPQIRGLFERLIATALRGPDGPKIRKSYEHAEGPAVRGVKLNVDQAYPDGLPLQSMPPSLLLNLPKLPKELEYRFVGRELVLRDVPANLIVDVIPDVITPEKK